jgi:hypothetical protein
MAPTTALALPPLAVRLPDAEPSKYDPDAYWQFRELTDDGHDDYATAYDYPSVLALYLAAGTPFSVQFIPGMADA